MERLFRTPYANTTCTLLTALIRGEICKQRPKRLQKTTKKTPQTHQNEVTRSHVRPTILVITGWHSGYDRK